MTYVTGKTTHDHKGNNTVIYTHNNNSMSCLGQMRTCCHSLSGSLSPDTDHSDVLILAQYSI